jgi:hypothetical protein
VSSAVACGVPLPAAATTIPFISAGGNIDVIGIAAGLRDQFQLSAASRSQRAETASVAE